MRFASGAGLALIAGASAMAPEQGLANPGGAGPAPGEGPFVDYRGQVPGRSHLIRVEDLPVPVLALLVVFVLCLVARPKGAMPQAPTGIQVQLYAEGLHNPRLIRVAPNGDLFVAESKHDSVRVLRGITADGKAAQAKAYADGLRQPFGIAFYPPGPEPQWLYVANTDSVVRFPYRSGDLVARGQPEVIVPNLPGGGRLRGGGRWTRALAGARGGGGGF